ncbi:hypothetical protein FGG08_005764 [Glutinoglossum americanum]|uniref:Uncharacterized protein n=1 Tax=Glutinoglossum americanum TaxID=1670608 RepID=A0A9P8I2N5_9PEZI|nr:hypothetical protein FGG08_005764 [Glutinoglossum americanum]
MSSSKHILRILTNWPTSALRPDLSFNSSMLARYLPQSQSPPPPLPPNSSSLPPAPAPSDRQINALCTLLENRYAKEYPVSDAFLRPAFKPTYYEDLLREIEVAPTRSWFGRMVNRWKGFLRFS